MRNVAVVLTLLASTILLPPASVADDSEARVARVSYVSGDVSYQRGDDEGWNSLRVNTPLVTGDAFYAPDGGRAEVNLGSGVVVRVDGGTEVNLVNNTSEVSQLSLNSGVLDIRARSFPRGFTLEIDTPSGAVTILEPGRYRVEINDRVAAYAVVRGGMSLALDGEQLDVREGESLELENSDAPTYAYVALGAPSPFQRWADDRDSRLERSASARYVNNDVVGYEDLDDQGTWRDSREYGRVWSPRGVTANWAPYQAGRWIWQDPYGWTWVSDESWGWAPYHYGRWIQTDNQWCWVPPPPRGYRGPAVALDIQPVYAPALVGFIGGSNWGLSLSIGGPAIGWVPLAPRERYYYPWQSAPRVTNTYTNITVVNAVTIVNYNNFGTQAVRPIRVERAQIEQAPVIGFTAVGVVPGRSSLVASGAGEQRSRAIPQERTQRPVVARLVPPPRPLPFAQKVVEIEKTGRPVARHVVIEESVGKPFVPGASAPVGVKAFSAVAPPGRKQMQARPGAEARGPKKFERDIAPPPAAQPPVSRDRAPEQVATPAQPDSHQAATSETKPNRKNGNPTVKPDSATPGPAAQVASKAPVAPEATPERVNGHAPPAPKPAVPPEVKNEAAPAHGQARPYQADPKKKKKSKDKNAPEPTPEPQPTPPPHDGG
jgi:hypothetical protein